MARFGVEDFFQLGNDGGGFQPRGKSGRGGGDGGDFGKFGDGGGGFPLPVCTGEGDGIIQSFQTDDLQCCQGGGSFEQEVIPHLRFVFERNTGNAAAQGSGPGQFFRQPGNALQTAIGHKFARGAEVRSPDDSGVKTFHAKRGGEADSQTVHELRSAALPGERYVHGCGPDLVPGKHGRPDLGLEPHHGFEKRELERGLESAR